MPENDLDLVRRGLLIENHFGWQDYNDLATKTTPITLTTADTWYPLTNDGLGPYTNKDHQVVYHNSIWDTSTNSFDFSSLKVGDAVFMRLSGYITTHTSNVEVRGKLQMAVGSSIEYSIPFDQSLIKKAGRHMLSPLVMVYIGNEETRTYPCVPMAQADVDGVEIEIDGWFVSSFCRE